MFQRASRVVKAPVAIRRAFGSEEPLVKTAFFDLHKELGGKMVPFAGYELPVQYTGAGVLKEHNHTRAAGCSSLFDVSHMGQIKWYGKDRVKVRGDESSQRFLSGSSLFIHCSL